MGHTLTTAEKYHNMESLNNSIRKSIQLQNSFVSDEEKAKSGEESAAEDEALNETNEEYTNENDFGDDDSSEDDFGDDDSEEGGKKPKKKEFIEPQNLITPILK